MEQLLANGPPFPPQHTSPRNRGGQALRGGGACAGKEGTGVWGVSEGLGSGCLPSGPLPPSPAVPSQPWSCPCSRHTPWLAGTPACGSAPGLHLCCPLAVEWTSRPCGLRPGPIPISLHHAELHPPAPPA